MTAARRVLVVAGTAVMVYAVAGAVADPGVRLLGVLGFLAAVLVLHDAVFLPVVIAAGVLLGRLPAGARTPARLAALTGLAVTVVALPLLLGFGRDPGNPSLLPRDYGRGLLLTLAVVAVPAAVLAVRRARKKSESTAPAGDQDSGK